jgi:hypothetical protein
MSSYYECETRDKDESGEGSGMSELTSKNRFCGS